MAVFTVFWCGSVFAGFIAALIAGTVAALIPLGMFAFGSFLGYRLWNLSVVATRDELIIRNYLSTKRLPKGQVESFRIGSPSMGSFGRSVMALLRDDSVVSMDATARPFRRFGGERQLEAAISDLRGWLGR